MMDSEGAATYDAYLKALMDISRAVTSDLYLEEILKLIVMVTAKVTGVEICSLWLVDETVKPRVVRLKATQAIDPEYIQDRSLGMDEGVVGFVARQGEPLIVADVLAEGRFKEKAMARKLGLVSMLGVPLTVQGGKVIGVLNCFTAQSHDFSDSEINLIRTVANQAAAAILNTKLKLKARLIQEELETRKRVERAKEILMRQRSMSGDEAYRWIQKRSMDSRKSMREVAEAVLLSEDLGYYSSIPHALDEG
ncbi:MAG: GAF and ANTAR domain-containing protein [Desulfobacteraceae bacterium]|jgi:GAF domain-containing protein|nr:GAF and ANTAR domain-containing protein [Desulfobacteraceae bacterium]